MGRSLLLIDDDALTREVLALMLRDAGWRITQAESGDDAVRMLQTSTDFDVILADLQMPGLHGEQLAASLRSLCGEETPLLSMTATQNPAGKLGYDVCLLKPVTTAMVEAAVAHSPQEPGIEDTKIHHDLSEEIYQHLVSTMPSHTVAELYRYALADADLKLKILMDCVHREDEILFRQTAHALKGGCGMLGAQTLAAYAGAMEHDGIGPEIAAKIEEFAVSMQRLRNHLVRREKIGEW